MCRTTKAYCVDKLGNSYGNDFYIQFKSLKKKKTITRCFHKNVGLKYYCGVGL